jgi:hypothetical protein
MAVTIYTWTHNHKSTMETLLNKTNIGHASFEIIGSKNNLDKIKNDILSNNPKFKEAKEKINKHIHTPQLLDQWMTENSEEEKIQGRLNELEECASLSDINYNNSLMDSMMKGISKEILDAAILLKSINFIFNNRTQCTDIPCKINLQKIYFSFFPKNEEKLTNIPNNGLGSSANSLFGIYKNKCLRTPKKVYEPTFNTYESDCSHEAHGVDISNLFKDIYPENMIEHTEIFQKRDKESNSSWKKKDRKFFKVKSGKLEGVIITQATYSEYSNFIKFILRFRNFNYRNVLINDNEQINKEIMEKYLKESNNYFHSFINDLNINLSRLIKNNENSEKIFLISSLIKQINEIHLNLKHYLEVHGLTPSDIITIPSEICDGEGLDERIIIENWLNIVMKSGFNHYSTNCSWAVKTAILPASKEYLKINDSFRIMPWAPLEISTFAKNLQKEILKKRPNIFAKNFIIGPKKLIYTKKEFIKIYSENSFSSKLRDTFHLRKKKIEDLLNLLYQYHLIADFHINHRIIFLEKIKEQLSIINENITTTDNSNMNIKNADPIKMLFQLTILEHDNIIKFLLNFKSLNGFKNELKSPFN